MRNSTADFKVDAETIRFCAIKIQNLKENYMELWQSRKYSYDAEVLEKIRMEKRVWKRMIKTCVETYRSEVGDVVAEIKGNTECERLGLMVLRIFGATDIVENELEFRCKMPMGYTACLLKGDYNFVELEPPHGVDYHDYVQHGNNDCPNARYEYTLNNAICFNA